MAPKRKSTAKGETESSSKRQKLDPEPTGLPCKLCTSSSTENVITACLKTKGKPDQQLVAHERCIDIIPELLDRNKKTWKLCLANVSSYRLRFKLKCNDCSESHGAKIQCSAFVCTTSFHINCATTNNEVVLDTEIETYGLHPFILLCKRHNQDRLREADIRARGRASAREEPATNSLVTPPATVVGSPSGEAIPLSPVTTPGGGSSSVEDEMIIPEDNGQDLSVPPIVLTPEQVKLVSDFLSRDPAWDALIRESIERCGVPTLTPVLA